MGTKRSLGPVVREKLLGLPGGRVADLFSGMGSVAASLASERHILANDTLQFTGCFARARFLESDLPPSETILRTLTPLYLEARRSLRHRYSRRLAAEKKATGGSADDLRIFVDSLPHAGNSPYVRRSAREAADLASLEDYRLATLYFSAAYFSTRQAIELDALRYAIDATDRSNGVRDWLLAAWLSAAGLLINAPGHTAQFMKPNSEAVARRIKAQWGRSVWSTFAQRLPEIRPLGERDWRAGNLVTSEDALDLVDSERLDDVAAVYADPPYTVDHYSRFYHVYETLYLYDFPASGGAGRYRDGRFFTPFSHVGGVENAFHRLVGVLAEREKALVLSYPTKGVLAKAGIALRAVLEEHYPRIREIEVDAHHSTMGASKGEQRKATVEKIYVCQF